MSLPPPLSPLEMTVPAGDGLLLKGILAYPELPVGRRHPLAVLAHQYPATADSFAPLVDDLLDLGIACLAFDQRGHGASVEAPGGPLVVDTPVGFTPGDFATAFIGSVGKVGFARIADDILRAASWGAVQNFTDPARILLVGASIGGSGVLLAGPKVPGLRGVVTLGAAGALAFGPDGPARIRQAIEANGAPHLLVSSESDAFDGAANVQSWSAGLSHVTPRLVPGAGHAMAIYYDVRDELLEWVRGLKIVD